MPYKDWTAFLQSKDQNKVDQAKTQPKLLMMSQEKQRKEIWD